MHATSRIVIRDNQGEAKYLVVVIDDMTERKKSEQRIAFMAHHDALTGLANRAAVAQKIEEAAARHRRRGDPFTVLLWISTGSSTSTIRSAIPPAIALLRGRRLA